MKVAPPYRLRLFPLLLAFALCVFDVAQAQTRTNVTRPVTDSSEARAINAIFAKWRILAGSEWNISGELCSGIASDNVTEDPNPGIKCDCFYNSGTTCHIYYLRASLVSDLNSSSNVVGPLPEELWSLTYLVNLNLGQNYLTGPLSPSVGNLTRLKYLSLSMNSLSGRLPKELGKLTDLRSLDLSFNNFSGRIPDSLFNLSSLVHLFLGNNKLTGSLPAQKASVLQYIDLSYNELSGSIPSWANQQDLQLNLVVNNFTVEGSNSRSYLTLYIKPSSDFSVLASGLNCLQRNFPCYRGDPQYSRFAIKCGGQTVRSATGIVHEADNETLGPAEYYVSRERRWGVSNVGLPMDSPNPEYENTYLTYFPSTRNPELFQSSRFSAGSLRYYGLGLQNGGYSVSLHFVETKFENDLVWKSLGRRVFDIYIQGNLVWKDFDIRNETGGVSYRTLVKDFTARVTENYLEIHLFWDGKGTCCVPAHGTYGPSISAISVTPADFIPTVSNNPPNETAKKKNRSGMIVGIVVSTAGLSSLSLSAIYYFAQRRKRQKRHEDEAFLGVEARPYTFSYAELRAATDDFSNKLGEGGYTGGRKSRCSEAIVSSIPSRKEPICGRDCNHIRCATPGYLAPEYAMRGHLTEKADVFSFGMVILEVVSGRANYDSSFEGDRKYLLEWAWHCHENKQEMDLVDPKLSEFNEDEVQRLIGAAFLCIQTSLMARPSMSRVVAMLSGDAEVPSVATRPGYLSEWNFSDTSTFVMENDDSPISITMTTPPQYSPFHASDPVLGGVEEEIEQ
ncbi:probable LRR receptor-like serine/threonine-protein kinase at1g56140 [Phtheirospermum japonicum]|uniref:non-specific serine/threonine protein kinase n=1 Tax=Phtheirospermum japonicum TaxID=374723 RepID=A0A830BRH1_9LAMI|nr:probable LRR receptor-like serine/threonine-protein kinase at1g56140 [Phtheirospermum japonicum]